MTNLQLRKTDDTDVVSNTSYDYYTGGGGSNGNNGRIRYITDHVDGTFTLNVYYDDYNRLTAYGNFRTYTYDEWNNLRTVSSTNGLGETPNYTLNYAANGSGAPATNRILNVNGGSSWQYEASGNVTNDINLSYTYDAAGRLKTAGSGNSYEYDGDGVNEN